jgi:hypothetical protein
MRQIVTLFDYNKYPPLPLQTIVVDKEVRFFTFYLKGTGQTLRQIHKTVDSVKTLFDVPVKINDFKAHVAAFNLPRRTNYNVYDLNLPPIRLSPSSKVEAQRALIAIVKKIRKRKPQLWHKLVANASVVYQDLEDRGVYHSFKKHLMTYSLETFTGRSKTLGFNLQGTTDDFDIRSERPGYFVHFDLIGADLLMAAHMSNDQDMFDAYKTSDPYARIEKYLNHPEFTRERCKKEFLKSLYSLSLYDPVLDSFPTLRDWMRARQADLDRDGYLTSVLGRRFMLKGDNKLSVFNAQFQGSVVHAVQASLVKLFADYRENLFTEVHDSIILTAPQVDLPVLIDDVVEVMRNPLQGWCDNPPRMAVRVSIGKKWRKWKPYKEFRF